MATFSALVMFYNASLIVQLVIVLLVFISIISWTVILFKYFQTKRALHNAVKLLDMMFDSASIDSYVVELSAHKKNILYKIYLIIEQINKSNSHDWQNVAKTYANGLIVRRMDLISKSTYLLGTIGNISPFIGLFGTIIGIINSLASLGTGDASLSQVGPGISEALYVTALGIFVAVPAVIMYNKISNDLNRYEDLLNMFAEQMIASMSARKGL